MAVPSSMTDLSVSEASNSPADSDTVTAATRPSDYLRALGAILRRPFAKGADVASATAANLGSNTDGDYFHVTGTTGLAASNFGTVSAGVERTIVFDGALTLTHNATSFILPGGANITTAAGDVAAFRSEGSGNWKCTSYVKASGAPVGSYQPLDALLTALAAQTTAANNVQAYSGADTPTLLSTGTSSGNIPLVGTASDTETVPGLSRRNTQAEAEAGTLDEGHMTPLKTAQAISALTLGVGQTWQDVLASRSKGVTYTNSTAAPIMLSVVVETTATGQSLTITVGGVVAINFTAMNSFNHNATCIIPTGATYVVGGTFGGAIASWTELR